MARKENDLPNDISLNIHIISRCTHAFYQREMKKLNITMGQFPFLMGINACDGISQERLSEGMHISKSTTAVVIQQLLNDGLITREVDEEDRRNFKLHITPEGMKLIPALEAAIERCHTLLRAKFTQSEWESLQKLNEKLRTFAESEL